ncbi:hypothetical protein FE257_007211 [Aspergillus nanangensis]|uniref:Chromate ion transporter n=1 Tax=Aspergillus nanangensis TaxID=2582783 RepID=A0AAD4CN39_ASPNN|nr:hypothetical protein FE257_007211 [Aspergillus nanangensis]
MSTSQRCNFRLPLTGTFPHCFVEGKGGQEKWVDEQTVGDQSNPGAWMHGITTFDSTKNYLHLPGAIGMYALSVGVQNIGETLPPPVYALLSGLNASTVGIIALAAVQLADKAIRDKLTRILVILGACAGICYNALWYFPVLMVIGGLVTVIWDGYLSQIIRKSAARWTRRTIQPEERREDDAAPEIELTEQYSAQGHHSDGRVRSRKTGQTVQRGNLSQTESNILDPAESNPGHQHIIQIWVGISICIIFFASFIGVLVGRGAMNTPPLILDLFANIYLAGTVIFGGGPVVIPLLRSYVVDPGWVSGRDFLIGLALIQAFPGPNFNFAVFLGSLAMRNSRFHSVLGAFVCFLGIFVPGITLAVAIQSFWRVLRRRKWVVELLRGINATAVGLVFTAVYRLWEIGYLTSEATNGQSLAKEPWWVVVAAITYAGNAWFKVPPAAAIVMGAVMGLCCYMCRFPMKPRTAAMLYNALIRTHHITSRKKVSALKRAADTHACFVLLRSGGCPGIMYVEAKEKEAVESWVNVVRNLRYKDFQLVTRPGALEGEDSHSGHSGERCGKLKDSRKGKRESGVGLSEVETVKEFGGLMEQRGVWEWWRKGMGYAG